MLANDNGGTLNNDDNVVGIKLWESNAETEFNAKYGNKLGSWWYSADIDYNFWHRIYVACQRRLITPSMLICFAGMQLSKKFIRFYFAF